MGMGKPLMGGQIVIDGGQVAMLRKRGGIHFLFATDIIHHIEEKDSKGKTNQHRHFTELFKPLQGELN